MESSNAVPSGAQLLTLDDLEPYLEHCRASSRESGRDGDAYFGPYSIHEPFDPEEMRRRTMERWTKELSVPGWRRAWGVRDGERVVGSASVSGGGLASEMHRVMLGMTILRPYRRRGNGTRLLEAVIAWCREQPGIAWLDLGVFSGNDAARALYDKLGFRVVGTTVDRFRMDGHRIDDTVMTLNVEGPAV